MNYALGKVEKPELNGDRRRKRSTLSFAPISSNPYRKRGVYGVYMFSNRSVLRMQKGPHRFGMDSDGDGRSLPGTGKPRILSKMRRGSVQRRTQPDKILQRGNSSLDGMTQIRRTS
jgi:hypothetical protein